MTQIPTCNICGSDLEWTTCWYCHGQGHFDAYDEDPINLSPGEEIQICGECHGMEGYLECPNAKNHLAESVSQLMRARKLDW